MLLILTFSYISLFNFNKDKQYIVHVLPFSGLCLKKDYWLIKANKSFL
jgi:hypothetical protein